MINSAISLTNSFQDTIFIKIFILFILKFNNRTLMNESGICQNLPIFVVYFCFKSARSATTQLLKQNHAVPLTLIT